MNVITVIFIVFVLAVATILTFAIQSEHAFDRACEARGGNPQHGRGIHLCLRSEATIKLN
jgi:hypothetical protein